MIRRLLAWIDRQRREMRAIVPCSGDTASHGLVGPDYFVCFRPECVVDGDVVCYADVETEENRKREGLA